MCSSCDTKTACPAHDPVLSDAVQALIDREARDSHPRYRVTCEDGFSQHEETMTVELYRELVMGYPKELVEASYWGAYGGAEGYDSPEQLWEGENFNRFTEQDYMDGVDAWLMPVAIDHNIVSWTHSY